MKELGKMKHLFLVLMAISVVGVAMTTNEQRPRLREFGIKRQLSEHEGDTLYLFVSDDLATWEYLHPFYTSDR